MDLTTPVDHADPYIWAAVALAHLAIGLVLTGALAAALSRLEPDLEALHERLSGVCVTCLDFTDFIRRIDDKGTLFYLDPPYWGCEGYYGRDLFSRERFEDLADQLAGLEGRFIMSLNDTPGVREVFGRFRLESVSTTYTASAKGTKVVPELLILNFEPGR